MSRIYYEAGDILKAAQNTFARYGNKEYADSRADIFIRRCGAARGDGPGQRIDGDAVSRTVFAMLDGESEKVFRRELAVFKEETNAIE